MQSNSGSMLWLSILGGLILNRQLQTTKSRTRTFGPHPPGETRGVVQFHPLVKKDDGAITGVCHDGLDPHAKCITENGVTCDPKRPVKRNTISASYEPYDVPTIPSGSGAPAFMWYLTKAPLSGLLRVRTCRDQEQAHCPCIGLLLYYEDGSTEALGQTRWDQEITPDIRGPIRIRNIVDEQGSFHVTDVQTACPTHPEDDSWQVFPSHGTVVWWFGQLGDKVSVYNE